MTWKGTGRGPQRAGGMAAGLAAALALAGCGGGGGGGGSSSGGGGTGGGGTEQVVYGPTTIPAGTGSVVGNAASTTNGVEADILQAPVGGVTVTILSDPTAPTVNTNSFTQYSTVYDIQPAGTSFGSSNVKIIFHYKPTQVSSADLVTLGIYYYDSATGTYQSLGAPTLDTTNDTVSVQPAQFAPARSGITGPADYVLLAQKLNSHP